MDPERLHVEQVATTCWEVQRGSVRLSGALTRAAAEAERELVERLQDRQDRRAGSTRASRALDPARD